MRRAWLGAFVLFNGACDAGGSTWAAEPPPATPAKPLQDPRMQVTISPLDDPASCIDGPVTAPVGDGAAGTGPSAAAQRAWHNKFKAQLNERLAELGSCTRTLKEAGGMDVAFDLGADGTLEKVRIPSTTIRDCGALECVRRGLSELKVPPMPASTGHSTLTVHSIALPAGAAQGASRAGPVPFVADGFDLNGATQSCLSAEDQGPGEPTTEVPQTSGRLRPQQIQALVRQHYGAFRHCYEAGLGRNPHLHGKVAIQFVIDTQGHVKTSRIQQNDLPDCRVAQCVRDEMRGIAFPTPEGGVVMVVYPIMLVP